MLQRALGGDWSDFCLAVGVAIRRDSAGVEEVVGGFALAAIRSSLHLPFAPSRTGVEAEEEEVEEVEKVVEEDEEGEEEEEVKEEVDEEAEEEEAASLATASLLFFSSQIFLMPGIEWLLVVVVEEEEGAGEAPEVVGVVILDERKKIGESSGMNSVRLNVRMMPKEEQEGRLGGRKDFILIWRIGCYCARSSIVSLEKLDNRKRTIAFRWYLKPRTIVNLDDTLRDDNSRL